MLGLADPPVLLSRVGVFRESQAKWRCCAWARDAEVCAVKLRKIVLRLALFCCPLLIFEISARLAGYQPLGSGAVSSAPGKYDFDAVLGWKPRPGSYCFSHGRDYTYVQNVWPSGGRATRLREDSPSASEHVVFLGCSFMFGYGLPDDETLPWYVQEMLPSADVVNLGVEGYGSYQCLLVMEEYIECRATGNVHFVYGFSDFHESRNVSDPRNIQAWARSGSGDSRVPYCTLREDGSLVRVPPEGYPLLPLREHSCLVSLIEDAYVLARGRERLKHQRAITERLLLVMQETAKSSGADFTILLQDLQPESREFYISFLKRHGLQFIDGERCGDSEGMRLSDGHPNGALNRCWASLVAAEIGRRGMP